ncbi:MAG: sulfurtransferase complex subunit TusB [Candidatus Thorarchaeota archaeon]|nr:sulfurtransferase complex subunit TusB [Candidatus Thorarchaeota archaeon]
MKYLIWLSNDCASVKEIVSSLARKEVQIEILLLQDGVYLADRGCPESSELKELGLKVHALKNHVEERGITDRLLVGVNLIDYEDVVDLIMEKSDKIISL